MIAFVDFAEGAECQPLGLLAHLAHWLPIAAGDLGAGARPFLRGTLGGLLPFGFRRGLYHRISSHLHFTILCPLTHNISRYGNRRVQARENKLNEVLGGHHCGQ